jgi:hypothetical protein
MIAKNSPIKVTLKNGSTILANVTKVDGNAVSWIAKDKTWKGKMNLTSVVPATPLECAEWAKAQAAKEAPIDPIMAKWTLGTIKRGPKMMEGYYFSIGVYRDGKKCGEMIDEGNGGCVITRFKDHSVGLAFEKDCDNWALANGADGRTNSGIEHFWGWYDEARPKGIDAKKFFENERMEMLKWTGTLGA